MRPIPAAVVSTEQALSFGDTPSVDIDVNGCGPAAALMVPDSAVPGARNCGRLGCRMRALALCRVVALCFAIASGLVAQLD